MADFVYSPLFQLEHDCTDYESISTDGVSIIHNDVGELVVVDFDALALLAERAFHDVNFYLRPDHLAQLAAIVADPQNPANDRSVALELLRNAVIAAEGVLPLCQDTGTATVIARKGHRVLTDGRDAEALSLGIYRAYTNNCFRYSQYAPLTIYEEKNTNSNLPADIDISCDSGEAYQFLFLAKGGGSSNKTFLYQQTKAILRPEALKGFLIEQIASIGTAACPPYHLAIVIGGTSPERVLKTVKLATAHALDGLPTSGSPGARAFRDLELEAELLQTVRALGFGAGYGGIHFCLDVRVIRLPRHGASCPIGIGVSCNAHRVVKAKINRSGIALERLERNPARYLADLAVGEEPAVAIDLARPMVEIRAQLSEHAVGTRLALTGPIVVARDIAHARIMAMLEEGQEVPSYLCDHPVYYAGPAKTPPGYPSGSLGATTAGRMDDYVPLLQQHGASLVMIGKGNRSASVTESCRRYGGFYLGSIGGAAARLARDCILAQEVLDFPELGMEAVYRILVRDFPAFLLVDDKGNDFYAAMAADARRNRAPVSNPTARC